MTKPNADQNPFTIINEQQDGIQIFRLTGTVGYGNVQQAKTVLREQQIKARYYVFDLLELAWIDSTGLGMLISFAKEVRTDRPNVAIAAGGELRELLEMAKLDLVFPLYSTAAEAVNGANTDEGDRPLPLDKY
ncbi:MULTISPECIES: STAS domain-containing protein [unclassified Paenibacillus]|uniref:STAS domain-containing protein n=1 Tax=unclassified Paenibacillus TaxID=185978 RepID=UPI0024061696|nr:MULTISPECIES: STAS domain-containing protein [unclassified Paenibacillus]MDF9842298.1 anti-anti-sigma factor [Paenibacillus sp. PastF-2]MDF9848825.1 anti-anti-sigma factor [Paenibacillus sp. PastM-2]MDF9855395.1 anti-anti-sigma factor [Paenibacillus sp. PastF-1]MDH6480729.1 anti-anti-sigma factor [Paenibacillus sp. PastH-2]MDH6508090.1 anti-anti-sigma factor [Paenibacillus sp. PastM-3]